MLCELLTIEANITAIRRCDIGLLWDTPEERDRKEREKARQGLMGSSSQEAIIGDLGRFGVQLQPAQSGSGYLGSNKGADAQSQLIGGLQQAGYEPQQIKSLLSASTEQSQKPTGLMQNLQAAGVDLGTKEGKSTMLDAIMKPSNVVNVGTNMKPPSGFRFLNPADPQTSPVEPIPGGPQTRGTGEQQKKIAAFEGIRGMVNAMQQGLKDGVDPNSLSMMGTEMFKNVPVLAGIWESFNGDAKKEAKFLNESENFGNTALQIMRGAQVGPAEQKKFEKSLPIKGMTTSQYENALNTSIRIFNDSMRSTMSQLGSKAFDPITGSDYFSEQKQTRLEELRSKQ